MSRGLGRLETAEVTHESGEKETVVKGFNGVVEGQS